MQAETETFLTQYAGLRPEQTGVRLKYRQYLNRQGTSDSYQEMPQCMTSWGLIYRALRGAFPNANYHEGASLNGFSQTDHGVAARFEGAGDLTGDILVGADGSRSFVRQKLMPDVKPHYAGYVAWRRIFRVKSQFINIFLAFRETENGDRSNVRVCDHDRSREPQPHGKENEGQVKYRTRRLILVINC